MKFVKENILYEMITLVRNDWTILLSDVMGEKEPYFSLFQEWSAQFNNLSDSEIYQMLNNGKEQDNRTVLLCYLIGDYYLYPDSPNRFDLQHYYEVNKNKFLSEFPELNEEGLLEVKKGNLHYFHDHRYMVTGYIQGYYFYYLSPYFRNAFEGIFRPEWLRIIFNLFESGKIRLQMKLDLSGRIPKSQYKVTVQKSYWQGAKFNQDRLEELQGLTVYGNSDFDKLNGYTEFYWSNKKESGKQLEIEEVVFNDSDKVTTRYAHVMFDNQLNVIHFDFAMKYYDLETFEERLEKSINKAKLANNKEKIFRVDGEIAFEDTLLCINNFFEGNQYLNEYFGGKK